MFSYWTFQNRFNLGRQKDTTRTLHWIVSNDGKLVWDQNQVLVLVPKTSVKFWSQYRDETCFDKTEAWKCLHFFHKSEKLLEIKKLVYFFSIKIWSKYIYGPFLVYGLNQNFGFGHSLSPWTRLFKYNHVQIMFSLLRPKVNNQKFFAVLVSVTYVQCCSKVTTT